MRHDGLGRLLLRGLGRSRFGRCGLAAGMRDHVEADAVIAKKALQLCQSASRHRSPDDSRLRVRERADARITDGRIA
jgi:hypothetical protein